MTFRKLAFNNVLRNKRIYLGHFFSSTFAVLIFFTYGLLIFHPNLQGELNHVSTIMSTFGKIGFQLSYYLIFVFSFLFTFYSVSAFLKNRKKEFGLLMLHGMSHQQLHRLIFFENMLIGIPSIVVGIGLGMVFSKLFLLVSGSLLGVEQTLAFYFPLKAMLVTAMSFVVLFLLISLFTSKMVKMNELVELIKSDEKPKTEPIVSVYISLLVFILFGAGYSAVHHSIAAVNYMTLNQLFLLVGVGVVFIVFGTYFFFTQLCVYVLHTLKNRETTFFKRTNLLVISELMYRMKDNARTFFIVTIISAVSFTAIGVCTAIANPELAKHETPYAFTYRSDKGNVQEKAHIEEIKKQLEASGFSYNLVATEFKRTLNGLALINLSTYNEYAKQLGYDIEKLTNENDSIAIRLNKNENSAEDLTDFVIKHGDLEVSLSVKKSVYIPELAMVGSPVIVSDAVYNKVLNVQEEGVLRDYTIYGFIVKDWSETSSISTNLKKFIGTNQEDYYAFSSLYLKWIELKQQNGLLSISSVMVGIVFFIFTLSFLYFRLFTDLERDQEQYQMISKFGLSQSELKQIVTRQMMLLFFLPIVVAMVHSSFAFLTLHQLGQTVSREMSVIQSSIIVLVSFICMQMIYFLIIRHHYLKRICTKMYS
ncbi:MULTISPECIES: FtsX-like permease family protein [Bacillus]|uniref:ABC transporter permease n=1 Tax=Bacillus thuringiensis serovar sooncheon TaxID=180891 RepID=A0A9Q5SMP1_BACTU|nr:MULTISPECIES: ABC transporter permease [Bacillus]MDC7975325.1 ABC transporter permease [Bacillus sp. BLCC-B18]OTW72588.1 ABC transporter permease [Bacillus thuringiensis serovar coreanensis]OTX49644.1 ABC transporter permease [Bacillus thuringiensis serovar sooncheon]OTX57179.1 ABC transporter permease [Bacillus thuringiensis serovar guiyangiensis]OTX71977.1 ABC transporter permease [Bacillus thuringiensis serovar roskildiensis]